MTFSLRVLIFAIFPAIRKNKFSQIKITANIFPAKIYSRLKLNILELKFATQKYSAKKSCLFNYNVSLLFRNKMIYNEILVYCVSYVFLLVAGHSIKMKILSVLGTGYFVKITRINFQQEKPLCPNRKNWFPQNTKKMPICKIKLAQTFCAAWSILKWSKVLC